MILFWSKTLECILILLKGTWAPGDASVYASHGASLHVPLLLSRCRSSNLEFALLCESLNT